jgi:5-methylcytosine-specific restriction protein B
MTIPESAPQSYWFVGAAYSGGTEDQMPRFLAEGIWENGYNDRHLDLVRSMQPGDRIAIKSSFTRKRDLPFDGRGNSVSVMAIKATGTITENLNRPVAKVSPPPNSAVRCEQVHGVSLA